MYKFLEHSRSGARVRVLKSVVAKGFWREVGEPVGRVVSEPVGVSVEVEPFEEVFERGREASTVTGLEWMDFEEGSPGVFSSYQELVKTASRLEGTVAVVSNDGGYREYIFDGTNWRKK